MTLFWTYSVVRIIEFIEIESSLSRLPLYQFFIFPTIIGEPIEKFNSETLSQPKLSVSWQHQTWQRYCDKVKGWMTMIEIVNQLHSCALLVHGRIYIYYALNYKLYLNPQFPIAPETSLSILSQAPQIARSMRYRLTIISCYFWWDRGV